MCPLHLSPDKMSSSRPLPFLEFICLLRIITREGFHKTCFSCLSKSWEVSAWPAWGWRGSCSWPPDLGPPGVEHPPSVSGITFIASPSAGEGSAPCPASAGSVWGLPPAARPRCAPGRPRSRWTWRRSSERAPSPPRPWPGGTSPGPPCSPPRQGGDLSPATTAESYENSGASVPTRLSAEILEDVLCLSEALAIHDGVEDHAGVWLVRGYDVLHLNGSYPISVDVKMKPTDISLDGWSMNLSSASWPSRDTETLFSPYSSSQ